MNEKETVAEVLEDIRRMDPLWYKGIMEEIRLAELESAAEPDLFE